MTHQFHIRRRFLTDDSIVFDLHLNGDTVFTCCSEADAETLMVNMLRLVELHTVDDTTTHWGY